LAISRRNKDFVPDTKTKVKAPTMTQQIQQSIKDSTDGRTAGELEKLFKNFNPRSIRYVVRELVTNDIVSNIDKCRCHSATIYRIK